MQTSIRVTAENRDALADLARDELGGATLDRALEVLLFEHRTMVAFARLAASPAESADYLAESRRLAEVDVAVRD